MTYWSRNDAFLCVFNTVPIRALGVVFEHVTHSQSRFLHGGRLGNHGEKAATLPPVGCFVTLSLPLLVKCSLLQELYLLWLT